MHYIVELRASNSQYDSGGMIRVPSHIMRHLRGGMRFEAELTEDGILYRYMEHDPEAEFLPAWVKDSKKQLVANKEQVDKKPVAKTESTKTTPDSATESLEIDEVLDDYRTTHALQRQGIYTIGELVAHTAEELQSFPGLGEASFSKVRLMLAERGLLLRFS